MSEATKRLIDKYYERVKRHLQETRQWDRIVQIYPDRHLAVRRAVREILKRGFAAMYEGAIEDFDPETLDWESMFDKMKNHDNVESFIDDLEELGFIPEVPEEDIEDQELASIEQQVREAFGNVRVLRSEDYEKLTSYKVLVDRLRKRLRNLREEKKKLEERIEEAFRRAAEERERLIREIERLKKVRITMVTVKFLKDMPSFVGVDGKTYGPYKTGDIASLPEANAAVLVERKVAEIWVAKPPTPPPVPKVKRELTKDEVKYLEDVFKATLFRELGRVPRDAMAEFRLELDAVRTMPLKEAEKHIERLAREIADRIRALKVKPPIVRPPPPKVEVEKPPVPVGIPPEVPPPERPAPEKPPELPKRPISILRFPRRPAREEKDVLERVYKETLRRWLEEGVIPYPPSKYQTVIRERIFERVFPSWDAVVREFNEMLEDIRFGRVKFILPVIPWTTREEAILHFFGIGWGTAKDIAEELNREYRLDVTEDEVVRVVKEAWKAKKDPRYAYLTEEELNKRLGI